MHRFFEFFIERTLWLWRPVYSLYHLINDLIERSEKKGR